MLEMSEYAALIGVGDASHRQDVLSFRREIGIHFGFDVGQAGIDASWPQFGAVLPALPKFYGIVHTTGLVSF